MTKVRRILVPTDFSAGTHRTLAHARELAGLGQAELHLLHILPAHDLPSSAARDSSERLRESQHRLERLAQRAALGPLSVVCAVRVGKPASEIAQYAREQGIEMIAMSTHGRTGLAHVVMGSVAEQVIRQADCPVLAVRPSSFDGHRADLADVARRLSAGFGGEAMGDRQEAWERMSRFLSRELDLAPAEAASLLGSLEATGAIGWKEVENQGSESATPRRSWVILADLPSTASPESISLASDVETVGGPAEAIDLLQRALACRASDVHIDPGADDRFEVRFRIDGRLEHYCSLDRSVASPLIQQYKIMAGLDIAQPFVPKEGHLDLPNSLPGVEVRITTAPVQGGTATALRLLSRDRALMPLEGLGLSEVALRAVDRILHSAAGLMLVTGPTGSGKTTTIYSLLNRLAGTYRNIVSIEDPVEFPLPFVRQLAVDSRHGTTMTTGLRTILRMDPDVVFVSEIRDVEAAEIAMRAASSGRFVFSTLHTRDVASTVTALRDLHIDNRSLAGNLTGLMSQRLLRRLCQECAVRSPIVGPEVDVFLTEGMSPPAELSRSVGCPRCRGTGYRDRIGVFEVVPAAGLASEAVLAGAAEGELRQALRSSGAISLMADALQKVSDGVTTLEEAQRMKWA